MHRRVGTVSGNLRIRRLKGALDGAYLVVLSFSPLARTQWTTTTESLDGDSNDGGRQVEDNKNVVRQFAQEVFDEGNIDAADRYLAPDFFNHVTGQTGIEPYKETIRFVRTFLNAPNVEDHIIAEGDKVALFLTASGVHSQPTVFGGTSYPATGKPFATRHVHLFRLRDGLLVEHWAIRDDLCMLTELSIVQFTKPD